MALIHSLGLLMILKAHNTCFYSDIAHTLLVETIFVRRMAPDVISMDLFVVSSDTHVLSTFFKWKMNVKEEREKFESIK